MKSTRKKYIIYLIVICCIAFLGYLFISPKKDKTEYTTAKVAKLNIIQTVSETGTVKSDSEINLGFLASGKIAKINVSVGDVVTKDQVLAELDYSALDIKKNEVQASLDLANADYNKLLSGATQETIAVTSAKVKQAEASYEASKRELEKLKAVVNEANAQAEKRLDDLESNDASNVTSYEQAIIVAQTSLNNTKATYQKTIDDSLDSSISIVEDKLASANNALDSVNSIITIDYADTLLSGKNPSLYGIVESEHEKAVSYLESTNKKLATAKLTPDTSNVSSLLANTIKTIEQTFDTLEVTYELLENTISSASLSQTTINTYKSNISTHQTVIGYTAMTALKSASQGLDSAILSYNTTVSAAEESLAQAQASYDDAVITAKNSVSTTKISGDQQVTSMMSKVDTALESWVVAQTELTRVTANADKHDIALAQARIRQAEASMDSVEKSIEDSKIKSPISGTITKVNFEVGEQAGPSQPLISMLGNDNFEIEVLISEADIAKIEKDDKVLITLDSFGDEEKFDGKVFFIEPAETEVQDVIYYKVKIEFNAGVKNVKTGMTANVIITTAEKENVLTIPSRAIIDRNGSGKFVRVINNGNLEEKKVDVGLRGDGGVIEILAGIEEGEDIVTYIKESK